MRYVEYPAPPALANWVDSFWVFESLNLPASSETIVADGFPELIVHFGNPFSEVRDNEVCADQPRCVVTGQLTGPLVLNTPENAGLISIRFRPAGLAPFLSVPMKLLTDIRVAAQELFVDVEHYIENIQFAQNDQQRVNFATQFLLKSFQPKTNSVPIRVGIELIKQSQGTISVSLLAEKLGMSKRNLELRFLRNVGVSPKQFCRIIRFRRAYDLLQEQGSHAAWVAHETGFFDQSHLIRDFQKFAGGSPSQVLEESNGLSHALAATD